MARHLAEATARTSLAEHAFEVLYVQRIVQAIPLTAEAAMAAGTDITTPAPEYADR
jgi:hypothetical protein